MLRIRLLAVVLLIASAACHRQPAGSFAGSLRCGMTRAEVTRLAQEQGYAGSDPSWLARATGNASKRSKDLSHLDLTFRAGRLVAFREGRYDARTKSVQYREVNLCGSH